MNPTREIRSRKDRYFTGTMMMDEDPKTIPNLQTCLRTVHVSLNGPYNHTRVNYNR